MKNLNPDLTDAEFLALAAWAQSERRRLLAETFVATKPLRTPRLNRELVQAFDGPIKTIEAGTAKHAHDLNVKRAGALSMGFYRTGGTC